MWSREIEKKLILHVPKINKKRLKFASRISGVITFPRSNLNGHSLVYNNMKTSCLVHWRKQLGDESCEEGKLYLYRQIKPHFWMEPYLKHVKKTSSLGVL